MYSGLTIIFASIVIYALLELISNYVKTVTKDCKNYDNKGEIVMDLLKQYKEELKKITDKYKSDIDMDDGIYDVNSLPVLEYEDAMKIKELKKKIRELEK